jgi:hypothetical protein
MEPDSIALLGEAWLLETDPLGALADSLDVHMVTEV